MSQKVKEGFLKSPSLATGTGNLLDFSRPVVAGILNLTPDSFYAGSRFPAEAEALRQAEKMQKDGARMLDIGAFSSRPGAEPVSAAEEARRLLPVLRALHKNFPEMWLSADTCRAEIAEAALSEGARMINDISGGADPEMFATVGRQRAIYVLMHSRGNPQTMQQLTDYKDITAELITYFSERITALRAAGCQDIFLDPGFGFAKTLEQNYELLDRLEVLKILGLPLYIGLSRKSMIWKKLGIRPEEALTGTTVLQVLALQKGASVLRVHDVREAVETIRLLFE